MGIEPTLSAWEAEVLPLNYTRATAAVYARYRRLGNARERNGKTKGPCGPFAVRRLERDRAIDQKPAPTVANTVVLLPPFWPTVTLVPMFASRPNTLVRAPKVKVP